jgi:hypothetical protein
MCLKTSSHVLHNLIHSSYSNKFRAKGKKEVNNDPSPEDTLAREPESTIVQKQLPKILKNTKKDPRQHSKVSSL